MIVQVSQAMDGRLELYSAKSEVQLKHIYEPQPGVFLAETANVIERALNAGYQVESMLIENRFLSGECDCDSLSQQVRELVHRVGDVPVYTADLDTISKICGFRQSRGILAIVRRKPLPAVETILAHAQKVAVLEDVENPTNVGAIFRSAAGLGFDALLLANGCTDPLYRRAVRVSMGTAFQVPWTAVSDRPGYWPGEGMQLLHDMGFKTVAMALSDRAVSLDDPILKQGEKLAVLLGNEENGLQEETQTLANHVCMIPMWNGVDSLNVAAASAVTFWELGKRIF